MDPSRVGDITELKAAVWLLEQGWEVFRNVGCTGLADLVAFDTEGQIHRIDVKKTHKNKTGTGYNKLKPEQKAAGIRVLYLDGSEFIWGEDVPRRGRPRKPVAEDQYDGTLLELMEDNHVHIR
jgi:PD-(D/E)XK endonuclease